MQANSVTYVLMNNMGGITSMLNNLICFRQEGALPQEAILLSTRESSFTVASKDFGNGIPVKHYSFSKKDNWYHALGNLAKLIGKGAGVLIANDVYEMLMLQRFNINKKVIQIVHDGYNMKLAVQYGDVVDVFICHSRFFYDALCQLFPERAADIYYLPYGIPITGQKRLPAQHDQPLKLVFLGRHDKRKGIFDLLEIEHLLQSRAVKTDWLILGKGPETEELQQQWIYEKNVSFQTPADSVELTRLLSGRDILVFPTKFEGFPVALLEAMSVGCVPVATDLPGGLRELVRTGSNGYLCEMDNNRQFAESIERLYHNRAELEVISHNAYEEVTTQFNAQVQSPQYQQLFEKVSSVAASPRHHQINKKIGSRLDQPWLPNAVTQLLRNKR